MKFQTVLVPIDFSDATATAIAYAEHLALAEHGSLILLHAFEDPYDLVGDAPVRIAGEPAQTLGQLVRKLTQQKLDSLGAQVTRPNLPVSTVMRYGSVAEAICQEAVRSRVDLVVMGIHSSKGLKDRFVGSVAERVARSAPCSVLTVHAERLEDFAQSA